MPELDHELKDGSFLDIGGGLYCTVESDWAFPDGGAPVAYVADALSPAAWGRADGPFSSRKLLSIEGDGMDAARASDEADYPRRPFPGKVVVTKAGESYGLESLQGRRFDDLRTLVDAILVLGPAKDAGALPVVDGGTRSEAVRHLMPGGDRPTVPN